MTKVAAAQSIGADRKVPKIKSSALTWDHNGNKTKIAIIRLPKGFEFVDIAEAPEAYSDIQQANNNQNSLVFLDQVLQVSWDGSWGALAHVVYSDHERVYFSRPTRFDYASRANITETDDHYVRWLRHPSTQGTGYCVVRRSDNEIIAGPYKTAAQAVLPRPAQVA